MSAEVSTLANGLRVATHEMPHLETTSLGLWVAAGARHESEAEHGLSHFLEHMAFKGTARRSARQIAEEIEAAGGDLNAATSLENTAYYARVLKGDERLALDVLADILSNSLFAQDDIERERDVILQEIAAIDDNPEELAYDLLQEAAYPGQPVGRPIIGTPTSVSAFASRDFRELLTRRYQPRDMIVSAAGAVRHGDLVRHCEALFTDLTNREAEDESPARYAGGPSSSPKRYEQCQFLAGFEAPPYTSKATYAAQILSGVLGGGASSRLFQEIREERGLCYAIYASAWGLRDTGMLTVHAAAATKAMPELIAVVGAMLREMAMDGPTAREVARAKAQMKSGLLMALESSAARAEQMARHLLAHGRIIPAAELVQNVEDVTPSAVRDCAAEVFSTKPSVSVVGAGRKSAGFADDAAAAFAA